MTDLQKICDALSAFGGEAVLSGVEPSGYPVSFTCRPRPARAGTSLVLDRPRWVELGDGPASLSGHVHDDEMWNMREFLAKGSVRTAGASVEFTPSTFVWLVSGKVSLSFLRRTRRAAAGYLWRRGLPRPRVPWDVIDAAKAATPPRRAWPHVLQLLQVVERRAIA